MTDITPSNCGYPAFLLSARNRGFGIHAVPRSGLGEQTAQAPGDDRLAAMSFPGPASASDSDEKSEADDDDDYPKRHAASAV